MSKWMDKPKDLAAAMAIIPLAEAWAKAVKAAVKAKLEKDPDAVPGFKLRKSGSMTVYEATEVAQILMDSNLLTWEELIKGMRFSMEGIVQPWADKTGVSKAEARKDLKSRLNEAARSKPKSPSIVKDHG